MPWWSRRGPLTGVVLLVTAALAGGAFLVVRQHSDEGRLVVGASRPGNYSVGGGYFSGNYQFKVPGAKITVHLEAGERASKLDSSYRSTRIKAPRDGLLVHLDWSAVVSGGPEVKYVGAHKATSDTPSVIYTGGHPTKLRLRSKGDSVMVEPAVVPKSTYGSDGGSDDDGDEKVVAVRGDVSDLALEVTFQGRTQSVSLVSGRRVLGDFASLYADAGIVSGPVSIEHHHPVEEGATLRSNCDILTGRMTRAPYLDGLGWAAHGRQWVLLDGAGYRTSAEAARWSDGDHVAYYTGTKAPKTTLTVNGKQPVKALGEPVVDSKFELTRSQRDYVFSVPVGDAMAVDITAELPLRRKAGADVEAPALKTLKLHTTTNYPAVIDPTVRGR